MRIVVFIYIYFEMTLLLMLYIYIHTTDQYNISVGTFDVYNYVNTIHRTTYELVRMLE